MAPNHDLDAVVRSFRDHPGLRSKRALRLVTDVLGPTDWISGPGDDAALVGVAGQGLLAAGEAIFPPFVEADPYGAGIAAVVANLNDIAAMGGRTVSLVDTLVAPEDVARRALEGMRFAAGLYGVPIVGGHLMVREGTPALSMFALGSVRAPLSAWNLAAGQTLLLACCLEGEMRHDFPFFSSIGGRGAALRDDIALLPRAADDGLCVAARDVSMAGILGSLAMLLEGRGVGVTVELGRLPQPAGVPVDLWLSAFPSFAFLLCSPPEHAEGCCRLFRDRGLVCEPIGTLDTTAQLGVRSAGRDAVLADLARETVTGLESRPEGMGGAHEPVFGE